MRVEIILETILSPGDIVVFTGKSLININGTIVCNGTINNKSIFLDVSLLSAFPSTCITSTLEALRNVKLLVTLTGKLIIL